MPVKNVITDFKWITHIPQNSFFHFLLLLTTICIFSINYHVSNPSFCPNGIIHLYNYILTGSVRHESNMTHENCFTLDCCKKNSESFSQNAIHIRHNNTHN